mmetsp:Transcript_7501/g.31754  ORF Transcript_7501/g.31754 Transcript_7501/m.31754 type:complete len:356 (-) Transcript_7501:513-1580(-)
MAGSNVGMPVVLAHLHALRQHGLDLEEEHALGGLLDAARALLLVPLFLGESEAEHVDVAHGAQQSTPSARPNLGNGHAVPVLLLGQFEVALEAADEFENVISTRPILGRHRGPAGEFVELFLWIHCPEHLNEGGVPARQGAAAHLLEMAVGDPAPVLGLLHAVLLLHFVQEAALSLHAAPECLRSLAAEDGLLLAHLFSVGGHEHRHDRVAVPLQQAAAACLRNVVGGDLPPVLLLHHAVLPLDLLHEPSQLLGTAPAVLSLRHPRLRQFLASVLGITGRQEFLDVARVLCQKGATAGGRDVGRSHSLPVLGLPHVELGRHLVEDGSLLLCVSPVPLWPARADVLLLQARVHLTE